MKKTFARWLRAAALSQGGAVAARRAHTPEVDGSSPSLATLSSRPRVPSLARGRFFPGAAWRPVFSSHVWPARSVSSRLIALLAVTLSSRVGSQGACALGIV